MIGIISLFVAWFLLKLIGLFTNLAYYHRLNTSFASPASGQQPKSWMKRRLSTKGTASQAAEKLVSLKGTAFRPYITAV